MKRIIFLAVFSLGTVILSQAQTPGSSVDPAVAYFDVTMLSNSIMGKLIPGLKLTVMQQQQVTTVVSAFLTQKENIIPLKTSDPAEYRKKQSGLFTRLKTRLSSILLKNQMDNFLGMKPPAYHPANTLCQLFY
jgi:hypothetical protein